MMRSKTILYVFSLSLGRSRTVGCSIFLILHLSMNRYDNACIVVDDVIKFLGTTGCRTGEFYNHPYSVGAVPV